MLAGFGDDGAEAEGEDEFAVASGQVDFPSARDIAIFGALIFPLHLEVLREVLPSVGGADESDGHFFPWDGTGQSEGGAVVVGEEHRDAFVVSDPAGVAVAAVGEVGREQGVQAVVGGLTLQRLEPNFLQNNVTVGVGENFLMNAVAAVDFGIDKFEGGDAGFEGLVFEGTVALFFGEEVASVGDEETEVTGAGLIDPRKIDFVQDAVTNGEPDLTVLVQGCASAGFGAGGPARGNAGPAGRVKRVDHEFLSEGALTEYRCDLEKAAPRMRKGDENWLAA